MKTVAITGANGFIGTNLTDYLSNNGYKINAIPRAILKQENRLKEIIDKSDIIINLAGANIAQRWSEEYKKTLYSSRIDTTKTIVNAINKSSSNSSKLLISTSAVGIYKNDKTYDENTTIYADDFLANLCENWEKEAKKANCRVLIFRLGVVLAKDGGALQKMITPFKLGLGGKIATGKQGFCFIHIEDLKRAFLFAITQNNLEDVANLTAPIPTTNEGLTNILGETLNRPTFFTIPEFAVKLIFSQGAKVLTDGQKVLPKRLIDAGFEFKFRSIKEAIEDIYHTN